MTVQGPEQFVVETPVSVCPFYMENRSGLVGSGGPGAGSAAGGAGAAAAGGGAGGGMRQPQPALGVAVGPFVFIYRNMRPYGKFTVPPVEVSKAEVRQERQAGRQKKGWSMREREREREGDVTKRNTKKDE